MDPITDLAAASAAATGTAAPAATPIPATAVSATAPASVGLTSDQLKARLDETRASAERNLLKGLGFEKPEDAQAFIKVAKELQAAQLSDAEKLQAAVKDLTPKAKRAEALERQLAQIVDDQFNALPEGVRNAIDGTAAGNAEKRLEMMRMLRATGLLTGEIGKAPMAAPANVAAPSAPPAPRTERTKFDEWQAVQKTSPVQASIFYQGNAQAIEKSRPA